MFKGITQNEATRDKYIKTLPFLTLVSESVKEMVHMDSPQSDHHDKLSKNDIDKVLGIKMTVSDKMRDPFSDAAGTDKLINISTGEALMSTELLEAKKLGLESIKLASSTNAEKIKVPKITTFALQQKRGRQKQGSIKQVKTEEGTVTRALCFTQDLSDEERIDAFSYEWLEYPPSLFEPDKDALLKNEYRMRKGTKSDFLQTAAESCQFMGAS